MKSVIRVDGCPLLKGSTINVYNNRDCVLPLLIVSILEVSKDLRIIDVTSDLTDVIY